MKICVVAYKFGTAEEMGSHLGLYSYLLEKLKRLAVLGHEIIVVCPYVRYFQKGSDHIGKVKIVRYWPPMLSRIWMWPLNRIINILYLYQTRHNVIKVVREFSCDCVYVWQAREAGYAVSTIKGELKVPFIFRQITAWNWHFKRTPKEIFAIRKWYRFFQKVHLQKIADYILAALINTKSKIRYAKTIYEKADIVIFLSRAAVQEAKEIGLDDTRARVLGLAVEDEIFKPFGDKGDLRKELGIGGDKVILFIGRIEFEEKGISYLLGAMPDIIQMHPQVNLIIIGSGKDNDRMKEMIQQLHIGNNVQVWGKKPYSELPKYINAADVLCVPSIWMEAFGKVIIEGMSCGIPVVTTDAGACPEINIDGVTGFVVRAKDSHALSLAIENLLRDPGLAQKFGAQARQRVIKEYTHDTIVKKFIDIVSTL